MKDSKFIELLNLYVDHEITAADAALLEAEIQQNPQRRQIYRQYCKMQKASVLPAENFRTEAREPADAGKVVEFAPRRRSLPGTVYAIGTLAAAACVATVVMLNRPTATTVAPTNPNAGIHLTSAPAKPVQPAARQELQPAYAVNPRGGAYATAAADRNSLDWMKGVQLPRVTNDEKWFQVPPAQLKHNDLKLRSTIDDLDALPVAIRFQR